MTANYFEAVHLPDDAKEQLCRDLLIEFGVGRIIAKHDELVHSCVMPWHDDRHPSASLNYKKLTYGCWSCGSSGGLLWLISTVRGEPTGKAREWVQSRTALSGNEFSLTQLLDVLDSIYKGAGAQRLPIPTYSERVLDPWMATHPWLTDPFDPTDTGWGRGIPEQNIEQLKIGYDDDSQRIVIPHFWKGKLVGWQWRNILPIEPKYEFSSEEDFPRDSTIYNHHPEWPMAVVVESALTVARHIHHLPMVATFGRNVSDRQVRILGQYPELVLWPDPDQAGWNQVEGYTRGREKVPGLVERLEPYTKVRVVASDWAGGPEQIDDDEADRLVQQAVPFAAWRRPYGALRCLVCRQQHGGTCGEGV